MPRPSAAEDRRKLLYCPDCKREFYTYKMTGKSECPLCHRVCKSGPGKAPAGTAMAKLLRWLLVLAVMAGLVYAVYKYYLKDRLADADAAPSPPATMDAEGRG
jgi:hypothetical protein